MLNEKQDGRAPPKHRKPGALLEKGAAKAVFCGMPACWNADFLAKNSCLVSEMPPNPRGCPFFPPLNLPGFPFFPPLILPGHPFFPPTQDTKHVRPLFELARLMMSWQRVNRMSRPKCHPGCLLFSPLNPSGFSTSRLLETESRRLGRGAAFCLSSHCLDAASCSSSAPDGLSL
jgi:hypothetical protein